MISGSFSFRFLAIVVSTSLLRFKGVFGVHTSEEVKQPIALHQLHEVHLSGQQVIPLHAVVYGVHESTLTATITSLPRHGKLYHVSQVYAAYQYEPKHGKQVIDTVPTNITAGRIEVIYDTTNDAGPSASTYWSLSGQPQQADSFSYSVTTSTGILGIDQKSQSDGNIVLVPSFSRILAASAFASTDEGWQTTGNRRNNEVRRETGQENHFIYSSDDSINTSLKPSRDDLDLWYFKAPSAFLSWQLMAYGGHLEFALRSLGGDYSSAQKSLNYNGSLNLVRINCQACNYGKGIMIGVSLNMVSPLFTGSNQIFRIRLHESEGWLKDPRNTLLAWTKPTKCEFLEVLSSISSLEILGDFTKSYETTALSNVALVASQPVKERLHLPLCAQQIQDRRCSCKEDRMTNLHIVE